jgi:hypothetical protein
MRIDYYDGEEVITYAEIYVKYRGYTACMIDTEMCGERSVSLYIADTSGGIPYNGVYTMMYSKRELRKVLKQYVKKWEGKS